MKVKTVEEMKTKMIIDSFTHPLTEKDIAKKYLKADKAIERLEATLKVEWEKVDKGEGNINKIKDLGNKYQSAKNANIAILYTEINLEMNHNKVEREMRKLKKEAA